MTDDFEDVPMDFRHYEKKHKTKPRFPVEWRMPKEKRLQRRAEREGALEAAIAEVKPAAV